MPLAAAVAAAGVAAALAPGLRSRLAGQPPAAADAAWIWSSSSPRQVEARAFYALRDFEVPHPPATARLQVLGDEEYRLFLNGLSVGSGTYADGAPLDAYEVAELLIPGANRLLVELRSSRGVGGLLLRLEAGQGAPGGLPVVSDGSWRIFHRYEPGLLGGWVPASRGEPPRVWGRPPIGRWGSPRESPAQAVAGAAGPPPAALPSARRSSPPPSSGAPAGAGALFDWGREVSGYLVVRRRPSAARPGLLFVGAEPPRPDQRQADAFVLAPDGAPLWRDSRPRTFRYALVLGAGEIQAATVIPGPPGAPAPPLAPGAEPVFGVEPPPRLSPLEAEIRRRLRSTHEGPAVQGAGSGVSSPPDLPS